ncbi:MAG: nuclear transport factor 2 family protein [Myxococcota bacterium]|nr:nuclear transport factor 2 family protein [Myxococcota bacterium]
MLYHLPSDDPRFGQTIVGRDALREFAAATFAAFTEPRFEVESVRSLPRGVCVRYVGSWLAPDGSRPTPDGAVLFGFEDALIAEIGVRLDVEALQRLA